MTQASPHTVFQELSPAQAAGDPPRIAVLVPCHNEEAAIGQVVRDFTRHLPQAQIFVYDNNSSDRTVEVARAAGARIGRESLQGKGNVVRRMFADIEADAYVLVDGDNTYDAASAQAMIDRLFEAGLDMVTGTRVTEIRAAYRPGHRFGNVVLTGMVTRIFGKRMTDMLSGYRVFSRRFVKSFPALSAGFETETELTIHALELRMPLGEMNTPYRDRGEGSTSKLSTYRDGARIFLTILHLVKEERPLQFFSIIAAILFMTGLVLGIPLVIEFRRTHLVPRLPTGVLATGIMMLSFLSLVCGLILDSVSRGRKEIKQIAYLAAGQPASAASRRTWT
ncbi:MAG TPA: glycosyltransferase family 2 protein [Acidobacteriaceae bacterium]|nr:glycosyltransferase family 2 protein [Acidobacteriaceae bacterium]